MDCSRIPPSTIGVIMSLGTVAYFSDSPGHWSAIFLS